jgi:hypothetical protein
MKWQPWCGAFIVVAALTPHARQNPAGTPGVGTPRPSAPQINPSAEPASGTGRIRGRVVAADTADRCAALRSCSPEALDDEGRFDFVELLAGRYSLQASPARTSP